jgi:lipopolysaccharide export system protein LptA
MTKSMTKHRQSFFRTRSLRALAVGFAGATMVIAGAQHLRAQAIAALNSQAPVNYAADRIELQDKQKRVVLEGNVDITQEDLRMRAARTTVAYTDDGALRIQRIDATGGVIVTRRGERASGDVAVYDFNRKLITMVGGVSLLRGTDTLRGGRLVIDLNTGISSVDGHSRGGVGGEAGAGQGTQGRVSGSFSVPKS